MRKILITTIAASSMLTGAAYAAGTEHSHSGKTDIEKAAGEVMHRAKDVVVGSSINEIGTEGDVTLSGKVVSVDHIDGEFTLRDDTGEIDIEQSNKVTVSPGDEVTVSGTITEDMGEKEIAAAKVTVTQEAAEKHERSVN